MKGTFREKWAISCQTGCDGPVVAMFWWKASFMGRPHTVRPQGSLPLLQLTSHAFEGAQVQEASDSHICTAERGARKEAAHTFLAVDRLNLLLRNDSPVLAARGRTAL